MQVSSCGKDERASLSSFEDTKPSWSCPGPRPGHLLHRTLPEGLVSTQELGQESGRFRPPILHFLRGQRDLFKHQKWTEKPLILFLLFLLFLIHSTGTVVFASCVWLRGSIVIALMCAEWSSYRPVEHVQNSPPVLVLCSLRMDFETEDVDTLST